jgi:FHA domain-containing protein
MSLDRIVDKLRQWGRPWASGSEPVEIHRAVLEDVVAQSVATGGGRRVFPFDRVELKLLAATAEDKLRLEAVVQEAWNLASEIPERLKENGVRCPQGLRVVVDVVEQAATAPGGKRYVLTFGKAAGKGGDATAASPLAGSPTVQAPAGGAPATATEGATPASAERAAEAPAPGMATGGASGALRRRPLLRLAVVKGQAGREIYEIDAERLYLGRLEEVVDGAGRVRRRNDVAFVEEGELNQTVSREHARIGWEAESRAYWLRDEGSASGTLIFRAGRSIEVSRHDRRGVRLESGDEVYLGRAAVKVEIVAQPG